MRSPKAPEAPDPIEQGRAQTGVNIATAIANLTGNMVNRQSPLGSLNYNQTGSFQFTDPVGGQTYDIPTFTAVESLTPDGQRIQNNTTGAQIAMSGAAQTAAQRMQGLMGQGINTSGMPAQAAVPQLQGAPGGNFNARTGYEVPTTNRVEEALMSRLAPQLQQDRASREAQLRQQGITLGSAAYDRAMSQLDQQSTDARMQAILAGGQEQSRQAALNQQQAAFYNSGQGQNWQQALQGAGFGNQAAAQQFQMQNQARSGALQEQVGLRNQQLNEIQALLGGSQVQTPNFGVNAQFQMPTTDYAGLQQQNYANQMAGYQQQMQNWNGLWGGLMGGAASLGTGWLMGRG